MKRENTYIQTQVERECTEAGESIEEMLRRLTANKEPIPENVPPIFTPKSEGVIPDYDIRADRFDTAYEATDKFHASEIAKSASLPDVVSEAEGAKDE